MVEFNNLSEALKHSAGHIEGAKNDFTVGDYLDVIDSSSWLGRVYTQLKLYFSGKGWVNESAAQEKIRDLDRETLASIQNICMEVIEKLSNPEATFRDSPDFNEIPEMLGLKISKKEIHQTAKEAANVGELHIDKSIKSIVKEMRLLSMWVAQEQISRHQEILDTLGQWNGDAFSHITEDPVLKKTFEAYVSWAKQYSFELPSEKGALKDAVVILNSHLNKNYYHKDGRINFETMESDEISTKLQRHSIMAGFQEWVAFNLENESFSPLEVRELFGDPATPSKQGTGLCRLNSDNSDQLIALRNRLGGGWKTEFAPQLSQRLKSVTRENWDKQIELNVLCSEKLVKPLIYEKRHPIFEIHNQYNFGKVEVSPLMEKARDQIERLIAGEHIELSPFGQTPTDKNDLLHIHFGDFKLSELESLVRNKLGEEPVLFEAFIDFLPRYVDQENVSRYNILALTSVFPDLVEYSPIK